jgi:hypothetical protein
MVTWPLIELPARLSPPLPLPRFHLLSVILQFAQLVIHVPLAMVIFIIAAALGFRFVPTALDDFVRMLPTNRCLVWCGSSGCCCCGCGRAFIPLPILIQFTTFTLQANAGSICSAMFSLTRQAVSFRLRFNAIAFKAHTDLHAQDICAACCTVIQQLAFHTLAFHTLAVCTTISTCATDASTQISGCGCDGRDGGWFAHTV